MSKESNVLQKIIAAECVNHFNLQNGIANHCVEQDKPCKYFADIEQLPRCWYLEEAILPAELNKAAAAMYQAVMVAQNDGGKLSKTKVRNIMERAGGSKGTTECSRCKTKFRASNNRQVYCDSCKKIVQREKTRARVQNLRKAGSV